MKAIILVAGVGSRLFPETMEKPKTLLKIGDKTILEHQIENLKKYGINEIILVTGHKAEMIRDIVGSDFKIIHNPFYKNTNSIVSVWLAREEMDDDFLIFNGDLFCDPIIIRDIVNDPGIFVFSVARKDTVEEDYRIIANNGKIVDMDKEITGDIYGAFTGVAKVSKKGIDIFKSKLEEMVNNGIHDTWFETVFKEMIGEGHEVSICDTKGRDWIEIDFKDELRIAREEIYPRLKGS